MNRRAVEVIPLFAYLLTGDLRSPARCFCFLKKGEWSPKDKMEHKTSMKPWPECPCCRTKRTVVCPYCKTEGNDFPLAELSTLSAPDMTQRNLMYKADCYGHGEDPNVIVDPYPLSPDWVGMTLGQTKMRLESEPIPQAESSERCQGHEEGNCSCRDPERLTSLKLVDPLDKLPAVEPGTEYPLTVKCPVCDELLLPKFLDTCTQCGYTFSDGVPFQKETLAPEDGSPLRSILVFLVMLALLGIVVLAMMM